MRILKQQDNQQCIIFILGGDISYWVNAFECLLSFWLLWCWHLFCVLQSEWTLFCSFISPESPESSNSLVNSAVCFGWCGTGWWLWLFISTSSFIVCFIFFISIPYMVTFQLIVLTISSSYCWRCLNPMTGATSSCFEVLCSAVLDCCVSTLDWLESCCFLFCGDPDSQSTLMSLLSSPHRCFGVLVPRQNGDRPQSSLSLKLKWFDARIIIKNVSKAQTVFCCFLPIWEENTRLQ